MEAASPTIRLRRLSAELTRLRQAAGLTRAAAAKRVGVAASTITRLEKTPREPDPATVRRLLDAYGATAAEHDHLMDLARRAHERGWWEEYRSISDDYQAYIGLESEADVIRNFESSVVPGLLQTEEYARALLVGRNPDMPSDLLEERVRARVERQARLLSGQRLRRLWVILDEALLRRQVGGREVIRAQLEHLLKAMQNPVITLQVLPFEAGAHPGAGPFSIMTFGHPLDPEVVYCETPVGEAWVEDPAAVGVFKLRFERLIKAAASHDQTLSMITNAIGD